MPSSVHCCWRVASHFFDVILGDLNCTPGRAGIEGGTIHVENISLLVLLILVIEERGTNSDIETEGYIPPSFTVLTYGK